MNRYLADTTVAVEMLRGNSAAKSFLETRPEISLVTVAELIQGARDKKDLEIVEKTSELLPHAVIDGRVSVEVVQLLKKYNLSHGLMFLDALIAASALLKKRILVTANVSDFSFINGLQIKDQKDVMIYGQ